MLAAYVGHTQRSEAPDLWLFSSPENCTYVCMCRNADVPCVLQTGVHGGVRAAEKKNREALRKRELPFKMRQRLHFEALF